MSDLKNARAGETNGTAATRKEPIHSSVSLLFERNENFVAARDYEAAPVIPRLGLAVVTCMDPRTDPAHFLGLKLSDAFVVRNVGGRVTQDVIDDLAFISQLAELVIPEGPLFEIAVIHHTQCGAGAFADATFRQAYAKRIGVAEEMLRDRAIVDPAATVQTDLARLRDSESLSKRITLSGYVYDVVSGRLQTLTANEACE